MIPQIQFPKEFRFYHLGDVRPSAEKFKFTETSRIVVFRVEGEARAVCTVTYNLDEAEPNADVEGLALELSNVLASKFVQELSKLTGMLVQISPPEVLTSTSTRYQALLKTVENAISNSEFTQNYELKLAASSRLYHLTYLPAPTGKA